MAMGRSNDEVGALLQEYADLLSITGGEAFKVRVYEKAARAVSGHYQDVAELDVSELRRIPNVGKSIAEKVAEYLRSGRMTAIEELRAAIEAEELRDLKGFGPKTEENIQHGIALLQQAAGACISTSPLISPRRWSPSCAR
jgi:DNA polymerase (family X)